MKLTEEQKSNLFDEIDRLIDFYHDNSDVDRVFGEDFPELSALYTGGVWE